MAQHLRIHWQIYHFSCNARRVNVALDLLKFLRFFFPSFFFPSTVVSCLPELRFLHLVPSTSWTRRCSQSIIFRSGSLCFAIRLYRLSPANIYMSRKKKLMDRTPMSNSCPRVHFMSKWYGFVCIFLYDVVFIFLYFFSNALIQW